MVKSVQRQEMRYSGPMAKIFLSYRRSDTQAITGRIYDRFVQHYGAEQVFMDVDTIPPGVDFRQQITDWISTSDVLVVVVGDRWLKKGADETSALDDPGDFVRIELEAALQRNIPVVPLLVDHAGMPQADELPDGLQEFAFRNAISVSSGRDFNEQMGRLFQDLSRLPGMAEAAGDESDRIPAVADGPRAGLVALNRRPPPRRSFATAVVWNLATFVIAAMVGFWFGFKQGEYRLSPEDFAQPVALVNKLHARESAEIQSLWRGFDARTRQIIEQAMAQDIADPDKLQFHLRKGLNRLIGSDAFILGAGSATWSETVAGLEAGIAEGEPVEKINRQVLDHLFPEELRRWIPGFRPETLISRFQSNLKHDQDGLGGFYAAGILALVLVIAALPFGSYYFALGSLELVFDDQASVDRFLNDYIVQMGFRAPERQGDELIYKATLGTILMYTVLTLRVVIDQERMLITAPLPLIRRLEKRLQAALIPAGGD